MVIKYFLGHISDEQEANKHLEQSESRTLSQVWLDLLNNPTHNVEKYLKNDFKEIVVHYFRSSNYIPIAG